MAELRLDVLTEPLRTGETVADVYHRYGISRDTYYRYRRRYLAQGLDGLEDQSRRPKTSPALGTRRTQVLVVSRPVDRTDLTFVTKERGQRFSA